MTDSTETRSDTAPETLQLEPTGATAERVRRCRELVDDRLILLEPLLLAGRHDELESAMATLRQELRETDLWAPTAPREHGGQGLPLLDHAFVSEVLGRSPLGHYALNCQAPDAGNMEILHDHGTPEQIERRLIPLVRGEQRSCFAMTEPELAGSNPTRMATTAVEVGDEWIIDGHKWFTTGADGAAFTIAMVVTDPTAERPHERASQIIIPLDNPGVEVVRRISVMGDEGRGWFTHCELRFDSCRVPKSNLLGPRGQGFRIAQERLGPGRIHHAMRWLGVAERAFELLCRRAATRELRPGRALGRQQQVRTWIADSRAEIDAARMLVLRAAGRIDRLGTRAARVDISVIKVVTAKALESVLDRAIQVHGALGITDDTPLAWWFRHERGARIYDGPDEVHRELIAREILKSYGLSGR